MCILAVALIMSASASAQGAKPTPNAAAKQGTILGDVTDQTGAVLAGATATITNGAGITQTATTNDRGEYSVEGLPTGTYSLTISAPAFKDFHSDGLALERGPEHFD